jgi:transaldolase
MQVQKKSHHWARYTELASAPSFALGPRPDPGSIEPRNDHGVHVRNVAELKIKLFADGADKTQILQARTNPLIKGFTTNPTLMRAAGVRDYEVFAHEILEVVTDRPISFEVFADEFCEMDRQAHKIASWADNVYVKIPVTNTRRESSMDLIRRLAHSGVKVNVTAILTLDQVRDAVAALAGGASSVVSVFAGRIADTGLDPVPLMAEAVKIVSPHPEMELLWASPRELLNIFQANDIGCHIITATDSVLSKLKVVGKNLDDYSLETVKMFCNDAIHSGYQL